MFNDLNLQYKVQHIGYTKFVIYDVLWWNLRSNRGV